MVALVELAKFADSVAVPDLVINSFSAIKLEETRKIFFLLYDLAKYRIMGIEKSNAFATNSKSS
jgi:hypothetical protein